MLEGKILAGGTRRKHLGALIQLCTCESDPVAAQALSSVAAALRNCMENDPEAFAPSPDEGATELSRFYAQFRDAVVGILGARGPGSWTPGPNLRQIALLAFLNVLDAESRTLQLDADPTLVREKSRCRALHGSEEDVGGEGQGLETSEAGMSSEALGQGALFPFNSYADVLGRVLATDPVPPQTLDALAQLARDYQDMRYFSILTCGQAFSRSLASLTELVAGGQPSPANLPQRNSSALQSTALRPGPIALLSRIAAAESKEERQRRANGPFYLSHLYEAVTRVYTPSRQSGQADGTGMAGRVETLPLGQKALGVTIGGVTFSGSRSEADVLRSLLHDQKRDIPLESFRTGQLAKFQTLLEQEERLQKEQSRDSEADKSVAILKESMESLARDILASGQTVELPEEVQAYASEESIEDALTEAILTLTSSIQLVIANPQQIRSGKGAACSSRQSTKGYTKAQHACLSAFLSAAESFVPHCTRHADLLLEVLSSACNLSKEYSFLALEAIQDLSTSAGISYEGLYPLLFSLITPACFQSKHKTRFVSLLIRALHSKRIPARQEAAFLKKLAQVALRVPADAALIILLIIVSCLLKSKHLRYLIEDDYRDCSGSGSPGGPITADSVGDKAETAPRSDTGPVSSNRATRRSAPQRSPAAVRKLCNMLYKSKDLDACAARADEFDLAELRVLGAHYLPSVNGVARRLLNCEPVDEKIDLDLDEAQKLDPEGVASFVFSRKLEGDPESLFAGQPQRVLRQHLVEPVSSLLASDAELQEQAKEPTAASKQAQELRETHTLLMQYMNSPEVDVLALESKRRSGGVIVLEGQAQKAKVDSAYLAEATLFGRWDWGGTVSGSYVAPKPAESMTSSDSSSQEESKSLSESTPESGSNSHPEIVSEASEASGASRDTTTSESPSIHESLVSDRSEDSAETSGSPDASRPNSSLVTDSSGSDSSILSHSSSESTPEGASGRALPSHEAELATSETHTVPSGKKWTRKLPQPLVLPSEEAQARMSETSAERPSHPSHPSRPRKAKTHESRRSQSRSKPHQSRRKL